MPPAGKLGVLASWRETKRTADLRLPIAALVPRYTTPFIRLPLYFGHLYGIT